MGIDVFNSNLHRAGLNKNIRINNYGGKVIFKGVQTPDTFQNNSVQKIFSESEIRKMIAQNPNIGKILSENNIPLKLNMDELSILLENHSKDVAYNASEIVKNLPPALKSKVNLKDLKDAALLHDFGKVLIPIEVLNKNSKLTDDERKIMDLHSELGYELLKSTSANDNVLNLVRYHHNNLEGSRNFVPDITLQVLNLADKYSALTESRVYKEKYTPQQALTILYKEVENGDIHPFLFNALVKSVTNIKAEESVKKC